MIIPRKLIVVARHLLFRPIPFCLYFSAEFVVPGGRFERKVMLGGDEVRFEVGKGERQIPA